MEPKHSLDPSGGPQSQSMETPAGGDNGIELKPVVNYNSDFVREQDAARQWTFNTIKFLFPEGSPSVNESTDDLTRTQGDGAAGEGDLEAQHSRRGSTSYAASLYPRPDGGLHANAYLVSACMVEGLVWGFPFSYGVFEQYYSTHPPFNEDKSTVAEIGTTATGVMYLAGAITFPLYNKWPAFARFSTIAGLPIMSLSLLAASFANKVWQLVLTQGVVYGSGGSIMYYASLMYLDDWFVKKKASAFGVVWAGSGAAGLIIPFLMNWLLNRYGPAVTLRVWAVVLAVCSKPLMFTLKPRIPAHMSSAHKSYSFAFAKTSTFWILMLANIMQSFGYFLPGIYLPNFAESLGHPEKTGTLLVALLNVGGTCSSVIIGTMTEDKDISKVITTSMVGAALTVFLLWGFGDSVQQLCVFSLFYGLFAGGFTSTYPGIVKELRKTDPRTDNGLLVGLLSAGRGIGAIFSGPISERLLAATPPPTNPTQGFDSQYSNLIIFTGVAHAVGSLVFVSKKLGWV